MMGVGYRVSKRSVGKVSPMLFVLAFLSATQDLNTPVAQELLLLVVGGMYGLQSSFRLLRWEGLPNRWLCATVVEVERLFWGSSSRGCFGVAGSDCGETTAVLSGYSSSSSDSGCTQFGCGRDIAVDLRYG